MLMTILEIAAFMAVAAFVGLCLGWVLRGSLGSEQAELAQLRSQLRALKKTQREQQALTKDQAVPEFMAEKSVADTKQSAGAVADAEKKPVEQKPVAKEATEKKPTAKKPSAAKITLAKKKSTAKAKSGRSGRKTLAEREADQAAGKQDFAEVVERIGASEAQDNLTKIHGVGKRYAEMLNELGLHSYEQISRLRKADLKTLAAALGVLDDRIEQEDWVSSSKALLKAQASKAAK